MPSVSAWYEAQPDDKKDATMGIEPGRQWEHWHDRATRASEICRENEWVPARVIKAWRG